VRELHAVVAPGEQSLQEGIVVLGILEVDEFAIIPRVSLDYSSPDLV
jgi:hypothetical protein